MLLQTQLYKGILKNLLLFCCILFSLLYAALPAYAQTVPNENNWSGTITYVSTLRTHHAAPYSEFIYKKWDHFYEQRMEVKLLNGKGSAKSTIALTDTNYNREQTGDRIVEQWVNETGNAQGAGNTEVSVSINRQNKTYSIEVPIPGTNGSKTKTFLCKGCGQPAPNAVTTKMGEDETTVMIEVIFGHS